MKKLVLFLLFFGLFSVASFALSVEPVQQAVEVEKTSWIVENIGFLTSGLFALLTTVFGSKFAFVRKKFLQLIDLLQEVENATKDDKITKEEMKRIVNKAKILLGKKLDEDISKKK